MTAERLMLRCPRTGTAVFTGVTLDRATFATCHFSGNALVCSACGETHEWGTPDVFFDTESLN